MLTKVDDILNLIERASRQATQKNLDLVFQNGAANSVPLLQP